MSSLLARLRVMDWWLNGLVLLLIIFSLAIMYSIEGDGGLADGRLSKQIIFVLIGLASVFFVGLQNYRKLINYAYGIYGIGGLMLILVLLVGVTIHGTTGWFQIFGLSLQPVEFAKIAFLLVWARFIGDYSFSLNQWRMILRALLLLAGYVVPILLQPDLGSAVVLIWLSLVLLFSSQLPYQKILIICGGGLILAMLTWWLVLADYQKARLLTFINPDYDALGSGYNVTQAVISVGSGRLFGRGLGLGPQNQLQFLPERESDFIFAAIAEELGFIGVSITIGLFIAIFYRLWRNWQNSRDDYSKALVLGFASLIFSQMAINIGMNLGIMPVTGIPLPFVSAGGSALIASCLGLGLVQSCRLHH